MSLILRKTSDPLADPETGQRVQFPQVRMRLTYEDIMSQCAPTLGPGSPDYVTVARRRKLPKPQDQNESSRQV